MAEKKKKIIAKPQKKILKKVPKKKELKVVAKKTVSKGPVKKATAKPVVKKAIVKTTSKTTAKPVLKKEPKPEKTSLQSPVKPAAKLPNTKSKVLSRKLFELEYPVRTSPRFLYNFLCTPSGLSEWFADDVNIKEDVFSFFWEGNEEKARVLVKRENALVRYRWLDDPEDFYFEFKIVIDDLTGDVALVITDFAEEKDMKAAMLLWDTQINVLLRNLGS